MNDVTLPRGFSGSGVACGLKASGKPDVGIISSERVATAAGVFTTNRYMAPPATYTKRLLRKGRARAVVVNAGNANACTGKPGLADAKRMGAHAAQQLGVSRDEVLVCSTGVIGQPLDMGKVSTGIEAAAAELAPGAGGGFARAIMTTDTKQKIAEAAVAGARIVGIGKGAGMIAPEMATMLVFLMTDAAVERGVLAEALRDSMRSTFGSISIDGCMSTNDTVLALANGAAGGDPIAGDDPRAPAFAEAVRSVCASLAEEMVDDGEGATKVVTITVDGAAKEKEARQAARAIADSILFRCAVAGEDPYWGRVLAALGTVPFSFDPHVVDVFIGGEHLARAGGPGPGDVATARAAMRDRRIDVRVNLHRGSASAHVLTNDLSVEFVRFNTEYTT